MTPEEALLESIGRLNVWRRGETRAPHKPLLLLLALGRIHQHEDRLVGYESGIRGPLTDLLRRFGPPRLRHRPEYPFVRLRNDGIWDIPRVEDLPVGAGGEVPSRALREPWVEGGLREDIYEALRSDPSLLRQAAQSLLDRHFPHSLHDDIREATQLPREWRVRDAVGNPRHRQFRHDVLRAYERRCAVCDFDIRLDEDLLGLEAAHIKWHAYGGPDVVTNGLALCTLHHKALDRGALGLEEGRGGGFRVLISSEVHGQSGAMRQLLELLGKPLRRPQSRGSEPAAEFVKWHRREVFREPARN